MSTTERDAIASPATGLLIVYNTTRGELQIYNGTEWISFGGANSNTAVGSSAGITNTTGDKNTFIGSSADASVNNLTNATAIGYGATVDANNKVRIGNANVTVIEGQVAWTNPSDARLKTNVQPSPLGMNFISKLRPVTYQWKQGDTATVHDGFIAQEVEGAMLEAGVHFSGLHKPQDDKGHYSLEYSTFVVPLVNAAKQQQALLDKEAAEIAQLKQEVARLTALVNQLAAQNAANGKK
jgi:hypothetical protein